LRWSSAAASASPVSAEGRWRQAAHAADAASSAVAMTWCSVLDLLGHRGLPGRPLDEFGVQQLVFVLVMAVQPPEDEIDVIGQERNPSR
jgi:hypothetical protein